MKRNENSEIEVAWPGVLLAAGLFALTVLAALVLGQPGPLAAETEMAEKTKATSSDKPELESFELKDSEVVITRHAGREVLQIDGATVDYFKTEDGYRLRRDVFRPPVKSLREAVERYLKSEAAK